MEAITKSFGKMCKSMGRAIDRWGVSMQGKKAMKEECIHFFIILLILVCPSCRVQSVLNRAPDVAKASFIAPSASVSGKVTLGENSSVWYGSTLRGMMNMMYIRHR